MLLTQCMLLKEKERFCAFSASVCLCASVCAELRMGVFAASTPSTRVCAAIQMLYMHEMSKSGHLLAVKQTAQPKMNILSLFILIIFIIIYLSSSLGNKRRCTISKPLCFLFYSVKVEGQQWLLSSRKNTNALLKA